uniref:Predicted protein n=1 Tax=Hordeum vulgare subsp. vulgare TaxID=112509 RepID=F2CT74_HORVV|nr:predicted protein [Hordeum vulgare subsp. vulgare]
MTTPPPLPTKGYGERSKNFKSFGVQPTSLHLEDGIRRESDSHGDTALGMISRGTRVVSEACWGYDR